MSWLFPNPLNPLHPFGGSDSNSSSINQSLTQTAPGSNQSLAQTFPGSWNTMYNGQQGAASEMQRNGLSPQAGPTSGLPPYQQWGGQTGAYNDPSHAQQNGSNTSQYSSQLGQYQPPFGETLQGQPGMDQGLSSQVPGGMNASQLKAYFMQQPHGQPGELGQAQQTGYGPGAGFMSFLNPLSHGFGWGQATNPFGSALGQVFGGGNNSMTMNPMSNTSWGQQGQPYQQQPSSYLGSHA